MPTRIESDLREMPMPDLLHRRDQWERLLSADKQAHWLRRIGERLLPAIEREIARRAEAERQ